MDKENIIYALLFLSGQKKPKNIIYVKEKTMKNMKGK